MQIESVHANDAKEISAKAQISHQIDLSEFIEDSQYDFNEILDTVKLIFLDDCDNESLIGIIREILITKDYIYIVDEIGNNKNIAIFDLNGKFVKRLKKGNGPGEIYRIESINYNDYTKQLVVQQGHMLYFYTADGNYIKVENVPFAFQEFAFTKDGYIFYQRASFINQHLLVHKQKSILFTDLAFKLDSSALPMKFAGVGKIGRYIMNFDKELLITRPLCDTIYSYNYETGNLIAKYIINIGKQELDQTILSTNDMTDRLTVENSLSKKNQVYFLGEFLETTTHLFFRIRGSNTYYNIYYDKISGHKMGGNTVSCYDIPNITDPYYVGKDWFIVPIYDYEKGTKLPDRYITDADNERISQLDEDSNPTLFLFKLKHF